MEGVYGVSERNQTTLLYRDYEFVTERQNKNGSTSWRCSKYNRQRCKARLLTDGLKVIRDSQADHNHNGNGFNSKARVAVSQMKTRAEELTATPSSAQAAVIAGLDSNVLMALPVKRALAKTLQRHRKKKNSAVQGGIPLPATPTDLNFDIPDRYRSMVLFDSGPGTDRCIMFGCDELIDGLARADVWLADGTFKVVPGIFFQLYSIHFNFSTGINPAAVYFLLTSKTEATYEKMLLELQRIVPSAAPKVILTDFERAAMNAFSAAYPQATVTGCYFHLCQSVMRKVQDLGLKPRYESDDDVRVYVRCLSALAYVPPGDVSEAFDLLADIVPPADHMDELTTYFEHTYIRGRRLPGRGTTTRPPLFPIDTWNKHQSGIDGIARTTNSVEGWHHSLQNLFQCHHPTLWSFMDGINRDMLRQKALFLQGVAGVQLPPSLTYRRLQERVVRAVAAYGRAEVLLYLRAIAHLSHS